MNQIELKWLCGCAALAAGIGCSLLLPRAAELWPVAVTLAALVALLGYGFAVRGWWLLTVVLAGLALAYQSTAQNERLYRESPWLRAARRQGASTASGVPELRQELSRRVAAGGGHAPQLTALNQAILLGERKRLPAQFRQVFVDSGAIHVFAISGLHVMVVAKILMCLAAFVFVPYRWQGVVVLPVLWGYVYLIGSPPSAVRAALMATFYFSAPVVWRRPNGPIAWSLAFLAIHVSDPGQLTNVGSLFSFVVMLSLVVASRVVRLPRRIWAKMLVLTLAAWAAGVPIAAATFGRLTPGGVLANLVLVVTAAYSVTAGILGLLLSFVWLPLAEHLNNLAILTTQAMVVVASAVARLPFASVEIPPWGFFECGGWYVALGLLAYLVRHVQDRHARF